MDIRVAGKFCHLNLKMFDVLLVSRVKNAKFLCKWKVFGCVIFVQITDILWDWNLRQIWPFTVSLSNVPYQFWQAGGALLPLSNSHLYLCFLSEPMKVALFPTTHSACLPWQIKLFAQSFPQPFILYIETLIYTLIHLDLITFEGVALLSNYFMNFPVRILERRKVCLSLLAVR